MAQILVVEDEVALVDVIRTVLTADDHTVLEAYDGKSGLEIALRERPTLIIADQMLPLMTGLEICHNLKKAALDPPIPLLLMTAGNIQVQDTCPDAILQKPFSIQEFQNLVNSLLEAHAKPAEFFG